jgi:hypothetical protein
MSFFLRIREIHQIEVQMGLPVSYSIRDTRFMKGSTIVRHCITLTPFGLRTNIEIPADSNFWDGIKMTMSIRKELARQSYQKFDEIVY